MSHFLCEHCGTAIVDSPRGYVIGCPHYPDLVGTAAARRDVTAAPGVEKAKGLPAGTFPGKVNAMIQAFHSTMRNKL